MSDLEKRIKKLEDSIEIICEVLIDRNSISSNDTSRKIRDGLLKEVEELKEKIADE